MQKQAPSVGRILVAVGFALSCFGLLLFLWIAFGGPVPLKSESYQISADFPEATTLAVESDVRIGGVQVGKVKTLELAPPDEKVNGQDATRVMMEIDPEFAPISEDARAILRAKTLLGETYVELTSGTESGEQGAPVSLGAAANVSDAEAAEVDAIEEGGHLQNTQVQEATQIDEIFNALDEQTRESFQRWQANAAVAIQGRGLDLNDSFGNLGPFLTDASAVLETLNRQKASLKGLVRDTGVVFEALTEHDQQLAQVITNSNETFDALASQERALAETFQILPTFQRESRLTFERLDEFQRNARPLFQDLIPVARDLSPTLRSIRELAPPLRSVFRDLDELIDVSARGLPALRRFLTGLSPVLQALDPFLANLNPVLDYLHYQRHTITDFLAGPSAGLSGYLEPIAGQPAPRRGLKVLTYIYPGSLSVHQTRLAMNRGSGYPLPLQINGFTSASDGIFPNFDCKNPDYEPNTTFGDPQTTDEEQFSAGETPPPDVNNGQPPSTGFAPCVITEDSPARFGGNRVPHVTADP